MAIKILARIVVGSGVVDDGTSALQIAGAERLAAIGTPSVPASGNLLLYAKTVCGRTVPYVMPDVGGEYPLQAALWKKTIGLGCAMYGTTSTSVFGVVWPNTQGVTTARTYSAISAASRSTRIGYVSSANAGSMCGIYGYQRLFTAGDGATYGKGFYFLLRFSVSDAAAVSGARMFAGITSSNAAPTNVEPSTLVNCIGVAQLSTDNTQLYLVYGGTTAQPAVPMGTNFPVQETPGTANGGALYDLKIFSDPAQVGQYIVQIDRVGTQYSFTYTITSAGNAAIAPQGTSLLYHQAWRTNNATALAVAIDINRFYYEQEI